jgi:hypothetical protein
MSRKGKQRGVDTKQEDVLQAVVRKTLIGYHLIFNLCTGYMK